MKMLCINNKLSGFLGLFVVATGMSLMSLQASAASTSDVVSVGILNQATDSVGQSGSTASSSTSQNGANGTNTSGGSAASSSATGSEENSSTSTTSAEPLSTTASESTSRIEPGSTIFLDIKSRQAADDDASDAQSELPLPKTKIFIVDKNGVLDLPYIGKIPLAGLTESEAILRLSAEPLLESYDLELSLLPVTPSGTDALELFGQSLFALPTSTFAPSEDIPVPSNYIIGPNDTVIVQLYGATDATYELVVTREGIIDFPDIGPVAVGGLSFSSMKASLQSRIGKQFIGVKSHVTMGSPRTFSVFVVGEANQPGAHTISALSTLTNALFAGGGVSKTGSLRNIQLKRNGKLVKRFDLYDLLLKGDTSKDVRLQPGDVIFVPPIGTVVGLSGEVVRPAIYELRGENSLQQVIKLAGGLLPTAAPQEARLERIEAGKQRILVDLDLTSKKVLASKVRNGDVVSIPAVLQELEGFVKITGYVKRPGNRAWRDGMRVTDVISSQRMLLTKPDLDYAVVKRHKHGSRMIDVFSVSLGDALANPRSEVDVLLQPRDEIIVFGHEVVGDRQNKLKPILAELERQANKAQPAKVVDINGSIFEPGAYPLEDEMRVSDLIRAAGQLKEEAYSLTAELSRHTVVDGDRRETNHIPVDLSRALQGDKEADMLLQPHDYLIIKRVPDWIGQETVELTGEVRFPGIYPITRGEQLSNVLRRAGGLTSIAFPRGAVFTRDELQRKEEDRIKEMADQLETALRGTILERVDEVNRPEETLGVAEGIVEQLRNTKSVGRMVINLPTILESTEDGRRSDYDITLVSGDKLHIPQLREEVTVIGEVNKATTHLYVADLEVDDYVSLSGGVTIKADDSNLYVIRADGSVSGNGSSSVSTRWWTTASADEVQPGDTIVVPFDAEKLSTLKIWRDVAAILGDVALAIVAIDAISDDNNR